MTAAYVPVSEIDASAPPPDVALVLPTLYSGGAERVHLNLAEYFVGRGLRVDLVVGKYFGSLKDKVPPGVRVISLDARRVLLSLPQYLRYLAAARPPVVLSSVENISIVACLGKLMSLHPHKLVVRLDNSLKKAGSLLFQPRRWGWVATVLSTFWKADALIAVSRGLQRQLERLPTLSRMRIACIYNPITGPGFSERVAASLNLPPAVRTDLPWVVAAGRLNPQKDYPTLLRAFAGVTRQIPAQLLILGEGDERAALEALALSLGIRNDVHFLGYMENPLPIMRRAQVFALTSTEEGFGNVLVEALAAGAPVVATDCPHGPREILRDEEFGRLVDVGDVAALTATMCAQMRADKHPISEALALHLEDFSVQHIGERYIDVLGLRQRIKIRNTAAMNGAFEQRQAQA
jgi:glycosyltransferase involved in cell wall biosynthesis